MGRFVSVGLNRLPTYRRLPRHGPRRRGIFFDQRLGPTDERSHLRRVGGAQLRYVKYKVAKADLLEHGDTSVSLPEYRPLGASLVRGQWVRGWRRNV